jgi:hypothetical protein
MDSPARQLAAVGSRMNRLSRLLVALLALLVAGSAAALLLGRTSAAEATPKQLAERDVAVRLADAPLPPGTHHVRSLPRSLRLDGPGEAPETPNLVDRGARFVTSMGAGRALAWFRAHPPAGGRFSGTGSSSGGGAVPIHEVDFDWDELPSVRERTLLVSVVARPEGGAAIRIDSQGVWVTPHPTADEIPRAARLLELAYTGPEERRRTATVTDPGEVAAFADLIDSAEAAQPGVRHCPELSANPPRLTITFRGGRGSPPLAEVEQDLPPGCGHPLELTVEGRKAPTLAGNMPLARRALARLGVKDADLG